MISLPRPSSPPPHCSSLPPSLPLRRSALEEINRGWSRYKSSAPRFPIHSPPHSSPPLSTAHYLCRPSAFLLFLLISRFLSRANSGKAPTGSGPRRERAIHLPAELWEPAAFTPETLFCPSRPRFISDSRERSAPHVPPGRCGDETPEQRWPRAPF